MAFKPKAKAAVMTNVYKLITPLGPSLHETDEVEGRVYIPSTIFNRCWFWRFTNVLIQVYRLRNGTWELIFNSQAKRLHRGIHCDK